jgi:hypothetical protein
MKRGRVGRPPGVAGAVCEDCVPREGRTYGTLHKTTVCGMRSPAPNGVRQLPFRGQAQALASHNPLRSIAFPDCACRWNLRNVWISRRRRGTDAAEDRGGNWVRGGLPRRGMGAPRAGATGGRMGRAPRRGAMAVATPGPMGGAPRPGRHGLKPAAMTAISPALGSRSSPGRASPARVGQPRASSPATRDEPSPVLRGTSKNGASGIHSRGLQPVVQGAVRTLHNTHGAGGSLRRPRCSSNRSGDQPLVCSPSVPSCAWPPLPAISMRRRRAFSLLGTVTVSTPSWNAAWMLSASTSRGSTKLRVKVP